MISVIEPLELKRLRESGAPVLLLDVRQPEEFPTVRFDDAFLIPLMEVPSRLDEIRELSCGPFQERVVYCRVGRRSEQAIQLLEQHGITGFKNLRGGIVAYSKEADPSFPQY